MVYAAIAYNSPHSQSTILSGVKLSQTLISAVARCASSDKYIIIAVVDLPVIDMAFNLYESSFKAHNIDNFLFVGFDPDVCDILMDAYIPCFQFMNLTTVGKSVFNSKAFLTKMAQRNTVIMKILQAGYNVLLTDLDVIFLVNPLPDIKVSPLRLPKTSYLAIHRWYRSTDIYRQSNDNFPTYL